MTTAEEMGAIALRARRRLLQMHFENKIGHIGGNLSCLDALLVLFHRVMSESELVVLSKGHSAGALYIALWSHGELAEEELGSFHKDGTRLSGHPVSGWHPRIRFGTGSLGHGLGLATGVALAKKLSGSADRVFALLSDGEWQEGSTWEALIFGAHQRLGNLCVLVDQNGLQGFGSTEEVASMDDLASRISPFGVELLRVDGHDWAALEETLTRPFDGRPRVVLMSTVKGKGVPYMEGKMEWHYKPMDQALYDEAVRGLL